MQFAAAAAMMMLFSGERLEGWITLAGEWSVRDQAMVCTTGPASIRTSYESDAYTLRFRYRRSGAGTNRMAVHSKMSTGGPKVYLTPFGVQTTPPRPDDRQKTPEDQWIRVALRVTPDRVQGESTSADGEPLGTFDTELTRPARGFIRFQTSEPGLEIRDVAVVEPGFSLMFDGQTLDGWEIMHPRDPDDPGWVIEDGIVRCRGRRSSWLRTLRTYDNFVLRLEFELPPRGNSGVFLRAPIVGRVSRNGLEIQLVDDVADRGHIKPAHHTGSIYDGIAPEVRVPSPVGQWNALEVHLEGKRIRTTLNGVELYDAQLTDEQKDTNSHRRPLATRRVVGFIGLQDHSTEVRFRRVRIQELPGGPLPE